MKALWRTILGVVAYRAIIQTLRYVNFLRKPKRDKEMALLPALIAPDDYCFDIGANYGQYAREISPLLKTGRLFSFEPSRITRIGLATTVKLLRLKNTAVVDCALSDSEGEQTLHVPVKAHGGLGIALAHLGTPMHEKTVTETVKVSTLDAFMAKHAIPRCDFIKCDAEGSEYKVLLGAIETLKKHRPVIQMEVWDIFLKRSDGSTAELGALLQGLGYRAYVWQSGKLAPVDGPVQDQRNNFFIPQEKLSCFAAVLTEAPQPLKEAV